MEARALAITVQSTFEALQEMEPTLWARVRAELPPESLAAIEDTSRISWIPVEHDVALTRAIFAIAGRERARECFRRMMRQNFETPVLGSLAEGALRLLGGSPERLVRWAPKVWAHLMRDSGEMVVGQAEPALVRLELRDMPPAVCDRDYLDGIAGAAEAIFDLAHVDGVVELEGPRPDGSATLVLSWKVEP